MSLALLISYVLWALGTGGELLAVVLMARQKLFRKFPGFFSYLVFHVVESFVGIVLYRVFGATSRPYYDEYWTAQAIGLALRFGVIYEIFWHLFQPYEALRRLGAMLFRWAAGILLLVAILAAAIGPSNEPAWTVTGAVVAERSVNVVQCGLVMFLLLFSAYFGLTWRQHLFGIALGFGLIASTELLATAIGTQFPTFAKFFLDFLPRGAYDAAAGVWILYLLSPEAARPKVHAVPQHDLENWNRALLELLQR